MFRGEPICMDVSVIIVNWNTCAFLRNFINSVIANAGSVAYEIIVIDNASTDRSVEMVRDIFPDVTLIGNSENRGFAAANNQGIAISRGRYVLLLNSDTLVTDAAIARTVGYADRHPDAAVVGCQVWVDSDTIQKTCFKFQSPWNVFCVSTGIAGFFPGSKLFGGDKMLWWDRKDQRQVDVVSGMFMLVRRRAIEQVGVMDEAYFVYSEEADWCYRFMKAGWKNVFWPGARIVHVGGGGRSSRQVKVKMEVQKVKSLLIFVKKNYGYINSLLCRIITFLTSLIKLSVCLLLAAVRPLKMFHKIRKFSGICQYCLTGQYADLPS